MNEFTELTQLLTQAVELTNEKLTWIYIYI